jgi:hypothetical protein
MNFTVKRLPTFSKLLSDSRFIQVTSGPLNEILILTRDRWGRYALFELIGDQWQMRLTLPSDEAYQFVQPMPGGNVLFVDNSGLTKANLHNAHVFDQTGRKLYAFTAGDGIEHVQTPVNGEIWVGFFDEGIFGDPLRTGGLGAAGLVCLSAQGEVLFRYADQIAEPQGIPPIDDCYALNHVDQNEVWVCYYGDFPVVALYDKTLKKAWVEFPRCSARAFAVSGEKILMMSAYRSPKWLHVDLESQVVTETEITDETGSLIDIDLYFARGNIVYFGARGRGELYSATLST